MAKPKDAESIDKRKMTILSSYSYQCENPWKRNEALIELCVRRLQPSLQDLHYAIYSKNLAQVRWVLSLLGCERVDSSIRSTTALSLAVALGSLDITDLLLASGSDPNKLSCDGNGRMEAPLSIAVRLCQVTIVRRLLEEGASVDILDQDGHSPLWIAIRERSLCMVKLLVEAGASLDLTGKSSLSPLFLATKFYGREHIAEYLIQQGCRINNRDLEGRGAFYWALVNGMERVVRLLIRAGVSLTAKDLSLITGRKPTTYLVDNPVFFAWLLGEVRSPSRLLRLSSARFRASLNTATKGTALGRLILGLPLPREIKAQLLLYPERVDHRE